MTQEQRAWVNIWLKGVAIMMLFLGTSDVLGYIAKKSGFVFLDNVHEIVATHFLAILLLVVCAIIAVVWKNIVFPCIERRHAKVLAEIVKSDRKKR